MKVSGSISGDWDKFNQILKDLKNNRREYQDVIEDVGYKIADYIKELILNQSIHLEPLVEDYRKKKIAEGYGDRILVRTQDFVNSIDVVDIKVQGYDIEIFISVEDGMTETGISMRDLAHYLEYGTENMTAREPIKKSWEHMKSEVIDEVMSNLKNIIVEDIR